MPKPKHTTKKVARSASRARRVSHPPLSTFNGTFIPSNAWHVKLGIDDGRAAVVFVVVVGVLLLGLGATLLGWAKTVADLRSDVISLRKDLRQTRSDLARLTEPASILVEDIQVAGKPDVQIVRQNQKTGERAVLIASLREAVGNPQYPDRLWKLRLLSTPTGSDAAFFLDITSGTINRLDLKTKQFSLIHYALHPGFELYQPSPDGHFIAYFDPNCEGLPVCTDSALYVVNLETDSRIAFYEPKAPETLCNVGTENPTADIQWSSPNVVTVQVCRGARTKLRQEFITVNPVARQ